MKTILLYALLLPLLTTTACLQEDALSSPDNNSMSGASWKITYFWDSDHEETDHFTDFRFEFADNGVITATRGTTTYSGTWSEGSDDSTQKLVIHFDAPTSFAELNDDWHIRSRSTDRIELIDVSGGNGGTDYLTFERI